MRGWVILLGVMGAAGLSSCDGNPYDDHEHTELGDDGPVIDCVSATIPHYTEVRIWPKCIPCHSVLLTGPDRQGAPDDVNFDVYDSAVAHAEASVAEVYNGDMPTGGYVATEEEKQSLYAWALCGAPE